MIARSCGRWIQRLSTSRCGLPHCSRTETRPRGAPSCRSATIAGERLDALVVAPLVHHEEAAAGGVRERAGLRGIGAQRLLAEDRDRRAGSSASTTAAWVAVGVATTTPSTSPSASRLARPPGPRRRRSPARRSPASARPPARRSRSSLRSRRMWRPQAPQPTSAMVDTRADPSGVATMGRAMRRLRGLTVTPRAYFWVAVSALVVCTLIVFTGAAVRLTGSGLGCPDWPRCEGTRITPELSTHSLIEFGNRMLTAVVGLPVPRRRAARLAPAAVPPRPRARLRAAAARRARAGRARRDDRLVRPQARLGDRPLPALDAAARRVRRARVARGVGAGRRAPRARPGERLGGARARRARGRHARRRHHRDRRRPARGRRGDRRHGPAAGLEGRGDARLGDPPARHPRHAARPRRRSAAGSCCARGGRAR